MKTLLNLSMLSAVLLIFNSIAFNANPTLQSDYRTKIVIIDTGLNISSVTKSFLCKDGHKSFNNSAFDYDTNGHGTNIAGLIVNGLDQNKFCIVVLKADFTKSSPYVEPINYARTVVHPKFINISGGGHDPQNEEKYEIAQALKDDIRFAVASGNSGELFTQSRCNYYPACYHFNKKNFRVIASIDAAANKGPHVTDIAPHCGGEPRMCGTSQSTAMFMNKWIKQ